MYDMLPDVLNRKQWEYSGKNKKVGTLIKITLEKAVGHSL